MAKRRPGVSVIIHTDKKILLGYRSKDCFDPNTWFFIAGGIDKNDKTKKHTARREAMEEAQFWLDIRDLKYFKTTNRLAETDFYTYRVDEEFVAKPNWEHEQFKWFSFDNLPNGLHPLLTKEFMKELKDFIIY